MHTDVDSYNLSYVIYEGKYLLQNGTLRKDLYRLARRPASQAVVRKWTQEALLRLHDGFARQRELAGLTNEFSPDPAPRGGAPSTRGRSIGEERRGGSPGLESEAPEPTR